MGRAAWKGSVRATVALQAHRSEVLLYSTMILQLFEMITFSTLVGIEYLQ